MELDSELCFQIVRTSNLVARCLRRQRKELGLRSGEARVLECLLANDGQLARDIARSCALDKSAMTPVLRGMVERGLVTRETLPEDGRASRIQLTEQGRRLALQVQAMTEKTSADLARNLSPEELRALLHALHSLAQCAEEA